VKKIRRAFSLASAIDPSSLDEGRRAQQIALLATAKLYLIDAEFEASAGDRSRSGGILFKYRRLADNADTPPPIRARANARVSRIFWQLQSAQGAFRGESAKATHGKELMTR
jgi:hypothetical protein